MTNYNNDLPTSSTLLEKCCRNETGAWERFMLLYKPLIYYWFRKIYNVESKDQDDLFQEVLFSLAKSISRFRKIEGSKFRNWLRQIVYTKVAHFYQRNKKVSVVYLEQEELDKALSRQNKGAIEKYSDEIPPRQEYQEQRLIQKQLLILLKQNYSSVHVQAFVLVVLEQNTSREAAQKLGLTPENVRQIVCRIKKKINDEWKYLL